jgi:23S rRNA (guanosine2251-2'-O)-methyltransferase
MPPAEENRPDSEAYRARKEHFRRLLTLYGRKPVLEALESPEAAVERLHVARGARGKEIDRLLALGAQQGAEIRRGSREDVSRISRNRRQDQGVAADVRLPAYGVVEDFVAAPPARFALAALDGVTTPANVGMAIRSCAAGGLDGVILPEQGTCGITPLVLKAAAGTLFRTRVLRCERLAPALESLAAAGTRICVLSGDGAGSLFDAAPPERCVFVLGNESRGVSPAVRRLADETLRIPLAPGVESVNVAVAAALVAFQPRLRRTEG